MAALRPVVLDANGHNKLLEDTENLTLELAPSSDTDATNKKFVDDSIEAEATLRANADAALQSNIDAEESAREAADSTLQSNIDAEEASRISADATLQTNIDALDTSLQGEIDSLETNLQDQIDTIDGLYVRDTGDNMSGNLTLGTTQITLDATGGNGTFAGALEAASVDGGSY